MSVNQEEKEKQLNILLKKAEKLGKRDILNISEIKNNPISILLLKKYMPIDKLDTRRLVQDLYDFASTRTLENKLKFIFSLYDSDGDNLISSCELFEFVKILNKGIIEDWKLQNIVDKTFAETGGYTTNITYEQFKDLIVKRTENILEIFSCDQ